MRRLALLALCTILCGTSWVPGLLAQAPPLAPPVGVTAVDHPWDDGTRVDLTWTLSSADATLTGYLVERADAAGAFTAVGQVARGTTTFSAGDLRPGTSYRFQVVALAADGTRSAPASAPAIAPAMNWFDGGRFWFLIVLLALCGSVLAFIALARRGMPMKVRQIAGLASVDDAVGRATEMGRPVLFVPGILDMNDIQTIAAVTILERVAKTVAEYDAKIEVPTSKSLVMVAGREAVQSAYAAAGRPESFSADDVYYVTDEQFGYVAFLQGLMARERPAACFYLGGFFAEALILAETGNGIGSIQIAGTAQPQQLPFFVAACDYTLIGEEFFAASAYLSGEPDQLGTLKGQDVGKLIVAAGILIGVLAATVAAVTGSPAFDRLVHFLTDTMLT